MNDKMMVESIFTECQKVKRVWKESGEDDNCYGAFCTLYGLIEKWDLTEVYKAWEEAQKVLSNSPLTFICLLHISIKKKKKLLESLHIQTI